MEEAMFELKQISSNSIPEALEKAERYRLLNEPMQAESICLDILEVDADNQQALVTLILALTDQFSDRLKSTFRRAQDLIEQLDDEYDRLYYSGIIQERRAKATFRPGKAGSGHVAYHWLESAMECYERAAELARPGNDDPLLRWNTCVRIIRRFREIRPEEGESTVHLLE